MRYVLNSRSEVLGKLRVLHRLMNTLSSDAWAPPAKIETLFASNQSKFSNINAPTAGARFECELPKGPSDFQLYSLGTPNGMKPSIMLEELGIPYDAHSMIRAYQVVVL